MMMLALMDIMKVISILLIVICVFVGWGNPLQHDDNASFDAIEDAALDIVTMLIFVMLMMVVVVC